MVLYQDWVDSGREPVLFGFKAAHSNPHPETGYDWQVYGFVPDPESDTGTLFIDAVGFQDLNMTALVYINPLTSQLFLSDIQVYTDSVDFHTYKKDSRRGGRRLLKQSLPRKELEKWVHEFFGADWHLYLSFRRKKLWTKIVKRLEKRILGVLTPDLIDMIAKEAIKWDAVKNTNVSFFKLLDFEAGSNSLYVPIV